MVEKNDPSQMGMCQLRSCFGSPRMLWTHKVGHELTQGFGSQKYYLIRKGLCNPIMGFNNVYMIIIILDYFIVIIRMMLC